jgi:STE24 endopeptidase
LSRILVLMMFVLWMAWNPEYSPIPLLQTGPAVAVFFGGYLVAVLGLATWCRRELRRFSSVNLSRSIERYNRITFAARIFIPLWFFVGIMFLGWWRIVDHLLMPFSPHLINSIVGVFLGTLPPFAAWAALWWAQYPAEMALKEEGFLSQLDEGLPVYRIPSFGSYFRSNLRLQLLFMIVPVSLIVLLHDVLRLAASFAVGDKWDLRDAENPITWIAAAAVVFLFAPEVLRRILHTEPLPNSPLRRRLETLCRRTGVKYRDILLWKTQNNMGNAAVMGFVSRYRYVLLSDLLLDTMTDEQIEAVFAHELGHIVHRHMAWLMVFVFVLTLFNMGGGAWATHWMNDAGISSEAALAIVIGTAYLFKFLLLFGFVSRRFERQADVFAARTMELSREAVPDVAASETLLAARSMANTTTSAATTALALLPAPPLEYASDYAPGHVGQYGAAIFGSALHRVAMVNNIPVKARSWCHGSIAKRMQYLQELSKDPVRTKRFDRLMFCLYGAMVFALFAGAAFCYASHAIP